MSKLLHSICIYLLLQLAEILLHTNAQVLPQTSILHTFNRFPRPEFPSYNFSDPGFNFTTFAWNLTHIPEFVVGPSAANISLENENVEIELTVVHQCNLIPAFSQPQNHWQFFVSDDSLALNDVNQTVTIQCLSEPSQLTNSQRILFREPFFPAVHVSCLSNGTWRWSREIDLDTFCSSSDSHLLEDVSCSLSEDFPAISSNGWVEVATNADGDVISTVHCASRSVLSGSATQICNNSTGLWSPRAGGQCISIHDRDQCHIVSSAPHATSAQCAANEIALSGAVNCEARSTVSASTPTSDLQGWQGSCINSVHLLSTSPLSITVQCCQASVGTLSPVVHRPKSSDTELLPAGAFFQHCSPVTHRVIGNNAGSLSVSAACAVHENIIGGGGACSGQSSIQQSQVSSEGHGWEVGCRSDNNSSFIATSTAICCAEIAPIACHTYNSDDISTDFPIPNNLASCGLISNQSILLNAGFSCMGTGTNNLLQSQTLLDSIHGDYAALSVCANESEQFTSFTCCNIRPDAVEQSKSYCPPLPASVLNPVLGRLSSSNVVSPNVYGSVYTIQCPESASVHLIGSASITCMSDGTWSNGGNIGKCYVVDSTQCAAQESFVFNPLNTASLASNSSVTLPTLNCAQEAMIMVSAGVECPSGSSLAADYPASISSWTAYCFDFITKLYVAPSAISGVCCPTQNYQLWSTCEYKESGLCLPNQFALSGGSDCSSAQDDINNLGNDVGLLVSSTNSGEGRFWEWKTMCSKYSPAHAAVHSFFEANSKAVCCNTVSTYSTPLVNSVDTASGLESDVIECSNSNSKLLLSGTGCPHANLNSGPTTLWLPSISTSVSSTQNSGLSWSRMLQCQHLNASSVVASTHFSGICIPSTPVCSISTPLPVGLDEFSSDLVWPDNTYGVLQCKSGFMFKNGNKNMTILCLAASESRSIRSPRCVPTSCPVPEPLPDQLIQVTGSGRTNDLAKFSCVNGTYFSGPAAFSICRGSKESGGYEWDPPLSKFRCLPPIPEEINEVHPGSRRLLQTSPQFLCEFCSAVNSTQLIVTPSDPYSFTVTWQPFPNSSLPVNAGTVQVSYRVVYPDPIETDVVSMSHINWSGQRVISGTVNGASAQFILDTARQIEGMIIQVQLIYTDSQQPVLIPGPFDAMINPGLGAGVFWDIATSTYQMPCGCSGFNVPLSPIDLHYLTYANGQYTSSTPSTSTSGYQNANLVNGAPLDITFLQYQGTDTLLSLNFVPRSLCHSSYRVVTRIQPPHPNYQFTDADYTDAGLPEVNVFLPQNLSSCPSIGAKRVDLTRITYSEANNSVTYCLLPLPTPMCRDCMQEYQPRNMKSYDYAACATISPDYWFEIPLHVYSSGAQYGALTPINNVNLTLAVLPPGATDFSESLFNQSFFTDATGTVSALISSNKIGSNRDYTVAAFATRIDPYLDSVSTVIATGSGGPKIVRIGVGDPIMLRDSSYNMFSSNVTTIVKVNVDFECEEPKEIVDDRGINQVDDNSGNNGLLWFCSVQYGVNSSVITTLSGYMSTPDRRARPLVSWRPNISGVTAMINPPVASGFRVNRFFAARRSILNATGDLLDSQSVSFSFADSPFATEEGSYVPIYLHGDENNPYLPGRSRGAGYDPPTPQSFVIDDNGFVMSVISPSANRSSTRVTFAPFASSLTSVDPRDVYGFVTSEQIPIISWTPGPNATSNTSYLCTVKYGSNQQQTATVVNQTQCTFSSATANLITVIQVQVTAGGSGPRIVSLGSQCTQYTMRFERATNSYVETCNTDGARFDTVYTSFTIVPVLELTPPFPQCTPPLTAPFAKYDLNAAGELKYARVSHFSFDEDFSDTSIDNFHHDVSAYVEFNDPVQIADGDGRTAYYPAPKVAAPLITNWVDLLSGKALATGATGNFNNGVAPKRGAGYYTTSSNPVPLNLNTTSSFTFSIWMKFSTQQSNVNPWTILTSISKDTPGAFAMGIQPISSTPTLRQFMGFGMYTACGGSSAMVDTLADNSAGVTFAQNTWYHMVFSYDDATKLHRTYLNGIKTAERNHTATNNKNWQWGGQVSLGTLNCVSYPLLGGAQCFAAWDHSISPDHVQALHTSQLAGCPSLNEFVPTMNLTAMNTSMSSLPMAYTSKSTQLAPFVDPLRSRFGAGSLRFNPGRDELFSSLVVSSSAMNVIKPTSPFSLCAWVLWDENTEDVGESGNTVDIQSILSGDGWFSFEGNGHTGGITLAMSQPTTATTFIEASDYPHTVQSLEHAFGFSHICVTYTPVAQNLPIVKLYLNGTLVPTANSSSLDLSSFSRLFSEASAPPVFRIGSRVLSKSPPDIAGFSGWLDELQVFSIALTSSHIRQLYAYNIPSYIPAAAQFTTSAAVNGQLTGNGRYLAASVYSYVECEQLCIAAGNTQCIAFAFAPINHKCIFYSTLTSISFNSTEPSTVTGILLTRNEDYALASAEIQNHTVDSAPLECHMDSESLISVTFKVWINQTTLNSSLNYYSWYPSTPIGEHVSKETIYRYEWTLERPENSTLSYGEKTFYQLIPNPYNNSEEVYSTPYFTDANGNMLYAPELAANGYAAAAMHIPPSLDQSICEPNCAFNADSIISHQIITPGWKIQQQTQTGITYNTSVENSWTSQVGNDYHINLTLGNGYSLKVPVYSSQVVLNADDSATMILDSSKGVIVKAVDPTAAITGLAAVPYVTSFIPPNRNVNITLYNISNIISITNSPGEVLEQFSDGGNTYYYIQSMVDGTCLTISSSIVTLAACDDSISQRWWRNLNTSPSNSYVISNYYANLFLSPKHEASNPPQLVSVNPKGDEAWKINGNQLFTGTYCLQNGDGTGNRNGVRVAPCVSGNPTQSWHFVAWQIDNHVDFTVTGYFVHKFTSFDSYDNTPIGTTTVTHGQNVMQPMIWQDLSTVSLTGRVLLAPNPLLPNIEFCGQPNIVVSAYATDDHRFANPLVQSVPTDVAGAWAIGVPMMQQYVLVASFNDDREENVTHIFSQPITLFAGIHDINGITFYDLTTRYLNATIIGGDCNSTVGNVAPVLIVDQCGGRKYTLPPFSDISTNYLLPAINARFIAYTGNSRDNSGSKNPAVNAWLVDNGKVNLNLTIESQVIRLHYFSETQIEVESQLHSLPVCNGGFVDGSQSHFFIADQDTPVKFTFSLKEKYVNNDGSSPIENYCYLVNPARVQLWIRDLLSDDRNGKCTQRGCPITPAISRGNTRASYSTILGTPFVYERTTGGPDYTRDFFYGIHNSVQPEKNVLHVAILGTVVYDGKDSIKLAPASMPPIYILRDPPGGESAASFSGSFTMSSSVGLSLSTGTSSSFGFDMGVSGHFEAETLLAPFGLGISIPAGGFSIEADYSTFSSKLSSLPEIVASRLIPPVTVNDVLTPFLANPTANMYDPSKSGAAKNVPCSKVYGSNGQVADIVGNNQNPTNLLNRRRRLLSSTDACDYSTERNAGVEMSQTISFEVSTSGDSAIIDGDGDVFIFAVSDILVATAKELTGDSTRCILNTPRPFYTASLNVDKQLLFVSQWQIKNQIIPASQNLFDYYSGSVTNTDSMDEGQREIFNALKTNVESWQKWLDYNDELKANAVEWPELLQTLVINSSNSGNQLADDLTSGKYLSNGNVVLSFSGDTVGLGFSIDTSRAHEVGSSSGVDMSKDTDWSVGGGFTVAGVGLTASADWSLSNNNEYGQESSQSVSGDVSVSFELADPDLGDSFDVEVRLDPIYNTPVYRVLAGRSRCRHEMNTVNRENVEMTASPATMRNLRSDQTVKFQLQLVSDTAFGETFSYFLNLQHETNVHGWSVTANGMSLQYNSVQVTLRPGLTVVEIAVSILPGTAAYGTADLMFTITGICYEEIASVAPYAFTNNASVTLQFEPVCPPVEFVGDLAYSDTFTVNLESPYIIGNMKGAYYPFLIYNPEGHLPHRGWAQAMREGYLLSMVAEFKAHEGTGAEWSEIPLTTPKTGNTAIKFQPQNSLAGETSSEAYQFAVDLRSMDGVYDFRVRCKCAQPNGLSPFADLSPYQSSSKVKTGFIDHTYLNLVSSLPFLPSSATESTSTDAVWFPGAPIRLEFDGPIQCKSDYSVLNYVAYAVSVGTTLPFVLTQGAQYQPVDLIWTCYDRFVDFGIQGDLTQFVNKIIQIKVNGITSQSGNPIQQGTISWAFRVAQFNTSSAIYNVRNSRIVLTANEISASRLKYIDRLQNNSAVATRRLLDYDNGVEAVGNDLSEVSALMSDADPATPTDPIEFDWNNEHHVHLAYNLKQEIQELVNDCLKTAESPEILSSDIAISSVTTWPGGQIDFDVAFGVCDGDSYSENKEKVRGDDEAVCKKSIADMGLASECYVKAFSTLRASISVAPANSKANAAVADAELLLPVLDSNRFPLLSAHRNYERAETLAHTNVVTNFVTTIHVREYLHGDDPIEYERRLYEVLEEIARRNLPATPALASISWIAWSKAKSIWIYQAVQHHVFLLVSSNIYMIMQCVSMIVIVYSISRKLKLKYKNEKGIQQQKQGFASQLDL